MHQCSSHSPNFSEDLTLGTYTKICPETPNLFQIGHKYLALYMEIYVFFTVETDINSSYKHGCATVYIFILLTVTCNSTIYRKHVAAFPL
jgi:hypothetical protein